MQPRPPEVVEVCIEVVRGGRVKRRDDGRLHYISPWASPFNYGSTDDVPRAADGDPQDVLVLGPRQQVGRRLPVRILGVAALLDGGVRDDKWLAAPIGWQVGPGGRKAVQAFFARYRHGKNLLARMTRRPGVELLDITWF